MSDDLDVDVLGLTAEIVSAHIGKNQIAAVALPELIQSVYRSLAMAGFTEAEPAPLTPVVPIRKSVFPDYIVCLDDGKKIKMLKRPTRASYNMAPQHYRERWDLPSDYPMTAPNYAERRSELANKAGLGRTPVDIQKESGSRRRGRARKAAA